MDNEIYKIYHNNFGIAFQWKATASKVSKDKIQIVFRDIGFCLTKDEVKAFYNNIFEAKETQPCSCCAKEKDGRFILLKTPSAKVDVAVSKTELAQVEDLIKGTLFQLDLDSYLNRICKN